jgi:hypothetical protein
MIENHLRYKANKDKRQGELSFIGIYTAQSVHSINRDDFNNHPEKPHMVAQAQGYKSYDKLIMGWLPPAIVLKMEL